MHSGRLRKNKWKLSLSLEEAHRNEEIIALADSQVLRWIDELNGITDADGKAREIKAEIKRRRKEGNDRENRKAIRQLYAELDELQFKPDYMCLIIDKLSDYHRACKGFSINGVNYKRLLGTNGGIKNSTIVFVSDRVHTELYRRIENDRDPNKELVTAKLEAYKALACSASTPVSYPRGVIVVDDVETTFKSDIVYLTDEGDGEPVMNPIPQQEITMDASDGYGIMLPSLAERWSRELNLDYIVSGVNTRNSFEKGMVVVFDFVDFAEKVADKYTVIDAWGVERDVREAELILTTSMLKLWDSYESCEAYIEACKKNGYTFGVAKTSPRELENERCTNYQFLQSYDLTDEDIEELISPTINEFREVIGGDWRKAVLFLRGSGITANNVGNIEDGIIKAVMIEPKILNDPFVQNIIYQTIKKKIDEAKVGVIKVHGNYSIIAGDPYLLCQNMFGLEKTGLLEAGKIYNEYWANYKSDKLACFRAPMTTHSNIRLVSPADNEDVRYWFQYLHTVTIFNGWDTATAALNG